MSPKLLSEIGKGTGNRSQILSEIGKRTEMNPRLLSEIDTGKDHRPQAAVREKDRLQGAV